MNRSKGFTPLKKLVLALLTCSLLFATGSTAANGATYKDDMVTTAFGWCMIKNGGGIGCSSPGIPAMTDGYAWMRQGGKVRLGDTGNPITTKPLRPPFPQLRKGDKWVKRGITCKSFRGVKCWNRAGHGFRLTKSSYRVW